MTGRGTTPVLGRRALNRALLARQLLLQRADVDVADAVAHLGGVQAQVPLAPYPGLWSRVARFDPHDLGRRIADGELVRMVVQRATVHLHTAADARTWRAVVQPVLDRALHGAYRRHLDGLDVAELAREGAALLAERPRPLAEVGRLLARTRPGRDPAALAAAVGHRVPLRQLPPRGVWGAGGPVVLEPVAVRDGDPADLVLRHLRAFGPASTSDVRAFLGIGGVREVVEGLGLRRFRDERGRELLDVPDGLLPDPDVPAPPRFLGEFDNVLLGHDDRSRVIDADHRALLQLRPVRPLLVDGFAAGNWASGPDGIEVRTLRPLPDDAGAAVVAEGERLLAALWPDAERRVRVVR